MNKFEKLIEYVINDEENKAADLFHQIVVDKSRDIYEDLMQADKIDDEDVDDVEKEVEADEINEDDDEMTFGADDGEADEAPANNSPDETLVFVRISFSFSFSFSFLSSSF